MRQIFFFFKKDGKHGRKSGTNTLSKIPKMLTLTNLTTSKL